MINSAEYIEIFIGILAILNPLGAIPIIVSLTTDVSDAELKKNTKSYHYYRISCLTRQSSGRAIHSGIFWYFY
jgi:small neutral amino acid transporter SnatA (MarC family)